MTPGESAECRTFTTKIDQGGYYCNGGIRQHSRCSGQLLPYSLQNFFKMWVFLPLLVKYVLPMTDIYSSTLEKGHVGFGLSATDLETIRKRGKRVAIRAKLN